MGRTSVRRTIVSVLVLVGCLGTGTQMRGAQLGSAEQQLVQLERDWCAANMKRDVAVLSRILADDYTGVGSRGTAETKAEALADLIGGDSDSVGSIAGGILGAMYPNTVNQHWYEVVETINNHDLGAIAGKLAQLRH